MNKQILQSKWRQFRGRTWLWRGSLTHNQRDRLTGKYHLWTGQMQEKYNYARSTVTKDLDRHILAYRARFRGRRTGSKRR